MALMRDHDDFAAGIARPLHPHPVYPIVIARGFPGFRVRATTPRHMCREACREDFQAISTHYGAPRHHDTFFALSRVCARACARVRARTRSACQYMCRGVVNDLKILIYKEKLHDTRHDTEKRCVVTPLNPLFSLSNLHDTPEKGGF